MTQYLFMSKSLTNAQRNEKILEKNGITAAVVKAPQNLSGSGCGYAVSISRRFDEALSILKRSNTLTGKIYRREDSGDYTEVRV